MWERHGGDAAVVYMRTARQAGTARRGRGPGTATGTATGSARHGPAASLLLPAAPRKPARAEPPTVTLREINTFHGAPHGPGTTTGPHKGGRPGPARPGAPLTRPAPLSAFALPAPE